MEAILDPASFSVLCRSSRFLIVKQKTLENFRSGNRPEIPAVPIRTPKQQADIGAGPRRTLEAQPIPQLEPNIRSAAS